MPMSSRLVGRCFNCGHLCNPKLLRCRICEGVDNAAVFCSQPCMERGLSVHLNQAHHSSNNEIINDAVVNECRLRNDASFKSNACVECERRRQVVRVDCGVQVDLEFHEESDLDDHLMASPVNFDYAANMDDVRSPDFYDEYKCIQRSEESPQQVVNTNSPTHEMRETTNTSLNNDFKEFYDGGVVDINREESDITNLAFKDSGKKMDVSDHRDVMGKEMRAESTNENTINASYVNKNIDDAHDTIDDTNKNDFNGNNENAINDTNLNKIKEDDASNMIDDDVTDNQVTVEPKTKMQLKRDARRAKKVMRKQHKAMYYNKNKEDTNTTTLSTSTSISNDNSGMATPNEFSDDNNQTVKSTASLSSDERRLTRRQQKIENRRLMAAAQKREKAAKRVEEQLNAAYNEAEQLLRDGKAIQAAIRINQALKLHSDSAELFSLRSDCYWALEKTEQAIRDAVMAVELKVCDERLVKLFELLLRADRKEEALQICDRIGDELLRAATKEKAESM